MTQLEKRLARKGSFLMLTHGEGYATDDGKTVNRAMAERHTQGTLFADMPHNVPRLSGNEDGLFPGMSQTWVLGEA